MKSTVGRALMLLLALSAAGCASASGPGPTLTAEIGRNSERWAEDGLRSYRYAVQRLCFCPPDVLGPVRLEVVEGSVVSAVYVENDEPVDPGMVELFPTVSGLFGVLAEAVARDAHEIDVTWDPETGIPIDFFIDYRENVADEELGFRVTELPEPLEP